MTDSTDTPRERKPLGIKRSVDAGEVKQTFSHGRTNKVVVEVKRRRLVGKPGEAAPAPVPEAVAPPPPPPPPPAPAPAARKPAASSETPQERVARLQREAEEARLATLAQQTEREAEERARALEDEKRRAEANREAEVETARSPAPAPEAPAETSASEPAAEGEATETAAEPAGEDTSAAAPAARRFTPVARPEVKRPEPKKKEEKRAPERTERGAAADRRSGKLTVTRALNEDEGRRARSLAALKRAREKERRVHGGPSKPREKQVRDVVVPEAITVQELANRMAEKGADLVKALFNMGMMVTVNQTIDQDTAELLVEEFGHNLTRVSASDVDIVGSEDTDAEDTLQPRPPVVTIMGHVDHGKTSLLDALRGTDVVKGEAGGITQHIGAYQIMTKGKEKITFLDTPGHAAFTEMRARGANVTDIVILVVAGDDAIMPQTIEAISHTKAAGVPMIVAITKSDRPEYNAQKIRERLLEHDVIVEAMSGDVQDVEVSAKTGAGLDDLIEKILLQAELLELKANPDRDAEAIVIEAQLDKGRGPVATVLVTRGTLKRGDTFVVGSESGRVRALVDDKGKQVKEAGPSVPVEVLGLGGVPDAGEQMTVVENEQRAREVAQYRQEQATAKRTALAPTNFDTMFSNLKSDVVEYPVVVKADVKGSVEAIVNALHAISNDDIKVRVLNAGVGAITESDVTLAAASKAPIIGFNVRPNPKARLLVTRDRVEMKYFDVIYHLTEEISKEMAGVLGPLRIENVLGRAEVKEVFKSGKKDKAAGLLVTEGAIRKGLFARLTRADVIVSATTIQSLRRFKDDVDEVRAGLECGVVLADTNDIKPGDQLEVFEVEERERVL